MRISYRFIEIVNETMPLPEGQSEHFEYKKLIVKNCTAAGSGERENAFYRVVKVSLKVVGMLCQGRVRSWPLFLHL